MPSFIGDKNITKLCGAEILKSLHRLYHRKRLFLLDTWYAVLIFLLESTGDFYRNSFSNFIEFDSFLIEGKNKSML